MKSGNLASEKARKILFWWPIIWANRGRGERVSSEHGIERDWEVGRDGDIEIVARGELKWK